MKNEWKYISKQDTRHNKHFFITVINNNNTTINIPIPVLYLSQCMYQVLRRYARYSLQWFIIVLCHWLTTIITYNTKSEMYLLKKAKEIFIQYHHLSRVRSRDMINCHYNTALIQSCLSWVSFIWKEFSRLLPTIRWQRQNQCLWNNLSIKFSTLIILFL